MNLFIWAFSFFPGWVWLMACPFCLSCQITNLLLLISSIFLLFLFLLFCRYQLFPSFCLLSILYILFLVSLGVELDCLFGIFLISWGRLVCYELLSEVLLLHPINIEKLCFHFGLSQGSFWLLVWFPLIYWLFSSMLFSLHLFVFFPIFFLKLISSFMP